jgi:IS5 family transposase
MPTSFSGLEYGLKKKQTRRDRFLAEIEAITPWSVLELSFPRKFVFQG